MAARALYAEADTTDIGSQQVAPQESDAQKPFTLELSYDGIGRSKARRHHRDNHVWFSQGQAELGMIFYYDPCHKEALNAAVTYTRTHMHLTHNRYFRQDHWDTVSIGLAAFSKRACGWLWQSEVQMNEDVDHQWNWNHYTSWDLVLWGRYDYTEDIGVHLGFIAFTGMNINRLYPIVGADWQYNEDWKLSAVYPMNISAVYSINSNWSAALAARFFDSRHRAGKHERKPESLYYYRAGGVEIGLNYEYCSILTANVHIGYLVGGKLTLGNKHWKNHRNYTVDSAPYVGGEVKMHF